MYWKFIEDNIKDVKWSTCPPQEEDIHSETESCGVPGALGRPKLLSGLDMKLLSREAD